MSKNQLSAVLRAKAEEIQNKIDETQSDDEARCQMREVSELINVLARIVERDTRPESWQYGGLLARAFGAPGDWGYSNPIGRALAAND